MIRCEHCGRSTPTPVRIVTQTRPKTYPPRSHANWVRRLIKKKFVWLSRDDPGGVGWEIVHEGSFCPPCARERGTAFG